MTYFADCFHTLFQREIHTGQIAILDSEEPMDQLLRRFSFLGSKIDWSQTLGHVSATSLVLNGDASVERAGFLRQYLPDNSPSAPVFYLNDNALSFTSRWQHNTLLTLGETLLANIPQHHYFSMNKPVGAYACAARDIWTSAAAKPAAHPRSP